MYYDNFTIVLPTYNEEKNIGMLIKELLRGYQGIRIVVMDDGSKDKTAQVVRSLSKKNRNVIFVDRSKENKQRGLTASAVDGIIAAKTKYVIVMDADLQHPTRTIREMSAHLLSGADLVVATRASVDGWELHRKIISKGMIVIANSVLAVGGRGKSTDVFSGFFGVRRNLFEKTFKVNRRRFVMGGYKILFDFLKCTRSRSLKIEEVPYSFGLRKHGASKAGFNQGMLLFKSFVT